MEVRNLAHAMLPRATPEERCRQRTIVALRRALNQHLRPRNLDAYAREGVPAFTAVELTTALPVTAWARVSAPISPVICAVKLGFASP